MANEYSAWGRGEEFLEKIIDFPIVLPLISDSQIHNLLNYELKENYSFINKGSLENIFEALPRNPRKLKLLLRYLRSLKKQIERHNDWEIDWSTIILWQLLKIESAHVARLVVSSVDTIEILSSWRLFLKKGEVDSDQHIKIKNDVTEIINQANIKKDDPRHKRILRLVTLIGEKNSASGPASLLYQFNLLDRPNSITWKEYDELFAIWKSTQDLESINEWVVKQADLVSASSEAVAKELWNTTIGYRSRCLDDAASEVSLEKHKVIMTDVSLARELAEGLFIDGLPSLGESYFRTQENFSYLLGAVQQWIHFRKNAGDEAERKAEESMLLKFCEFSNEDSLGYMVSLAPWKIGSSVWGEHETQFYELIKKLVDVVEPNLADILLDLFKERGGISSLWGKDTSIAQKYVLFHIDGPLWRDERKQELMNIFGDSAADPYVYQNAYELLRMLSYGEKEGIGISSTREQLQAIIKDTDIAGAIWVSATLRPIQYRCHSKVREIRQQFIDIAKTDGHLPWPEWLEEEQREGVPAP